MAETTETTEIAPRFITGRCANYTQIPFQIQVNITTDEYSVLARGEYPSPEIQSLRAKRQEIKPPPAADDEEPSFTAEQLEQRKALDEEITRLQEAQNLAFYDLFSRVFGRRVYKGYGLEIDLSTAAAAEAVLDNPKLPRDLRFWIRNAPNKAVDYELEQLGENFEMSFSAKP